MSYLLHVLLFPEETNPHPFSFDGFIIFLLSIFYKNTFPFYSYFRFLWLTYIDLCESKKSPLMWVLINVFKFPLSLSSSISFLSVLKVSWWDMNNDKCDYSLHKSVWKETCVARCISKLSISHNIFFLHKCIGKEFSGFAQNYFPSKKCKIAIQIVKILVTWWYYHC